MAKKYENHKLKAYFKKYINTMDVDKRFKPYLVDILMRRAKQYDLSPEEIRTDVMTLIGSLDSIEIISANDPIMENAWGLYAPDQRKIYLSDDCARNKNNSNEMIYQTLAHEVYHALSRDPYTRADRLSGYNRYTGQQNRSLLETIVEKASFKTVFDTGRIENAYYNHNARGYSDMTFVLDAIEAVYGVNEEALLRNGIQSRDKMTEFLASVVGEDTQKTGEFLDELEAHLAELHSTLYPIHEADRVSPEVEAANISQALTNIKRICHGKILDRVKSLAIDNLDNVDYLAFDFNKINAIFNERTKYFESLSRGKGIEAHIEEHMMNDDGLSYISETTSKRIQSLMAIKDSPITKGSDTEKTLFRFARIGNLNMYNMYIHQHGLQLSKLEDVSIDADAFEDILPEAMIEIPKERFDQLVIERNDSPQMGEEWDNSSISNIYEDFQPTLREKMNAFFKKINPFKKRDEQQALPPAQVAEEHMQTSYENPFRVSDEIIRQTEDIGKSFNPNLQSKEDPKKSDVER